MKPSDFYLTSRQIFGTMVPGMLWIVALRLWTGDFLPQFLVAGWPKPTDAAALTFFILTSLLASFVAGFLLHRLAFNTTELLDNVLLKRFKKVRRDALVKRVRQKLIVRHQEDMGYLLTLKEGEKNAKEELFALCKNCIINRSPDLARALTEKEDEINFYGSVLPPSFALGLTLTFCWNVSHWFVFAVSFVTWTYLLVLFHLNRVDEEDICFNRILLLDTDFGKNS